MVELVLHAARLEAEALNTAPRVLDHDARRASYVRGQVGDGETALTGDLGAVGAAVLEDRLERVRVELGLAAIAVNRIDELRAARARPSHVITVYGADHPGIVHAVSAALAEREVNITGLETRLAGDADSPLYVMILEVAMGEAPEAGVEASLREVAEEAKVEVSMRPLEAEAL